MVVKVSGRLSLPRGDLKSAIKNSPFLLSTFQIKQLGHRGSRLQAVML